MGRISAYGFSPAVLVDLRNSSGLSQVELADRVGVGVATLRAWERGRKIPQADALGLLSAALSDALKASVTVADLVDIPDEGRTLSDWRVLSALPQVEAARRAGISPSHYGSIERGTSGVSDHTASLIAGALNISVADVKAASLCSQRVHRRN